METKQIVVYVDGSSTVFPDKNRDKFGGIGVYFPDKNIKIQDSYKSDTVTNQKMELMASIVAIKRCITDNKNSLWQLTIYTDSMYVINCMTKWASKWILFDWTRYNGKKEMEITNLKLIKQLYKLSKLYPVSYSHVRSHQKEPTDKNSSKWQHWQGNKIADELANKAMTSLRDKD